MEGYSSGTYPVPVRAAALVPGNQQAELSADSSVPLTNGAQTISFNHIDMTATGAFSSRNFNSQPSQHLDNFHGSGNNLGTYRFFYDNNAAQAAGIYTGRVTFTLSSP